jgi:hypothetical protein
VACDGGVHGHLHVSTEDGQPVSDASIEIDRGDDRGDSNITDRTNANGDADVGATVAPGHRDVPVYITKPGFVPCAIAIPTLTRNVVEITLSRRGLGSYSLQREAVRSCGPVPQSTK